MTSTELQLLFSPASSTPSKVTGKKKEDCRVVVNGAGSAGVAITKLLLTYGFPHITMCDINGIISKDSPDLNWMQKEMTKVTNLEGRIGLLADALKGADILCRCICPEYCYPGDGCIHEPGCNPVCYGEPGT